MLTAYPSRHNSPGRSLTAGQSTFLFDLLVTVGLYGREVPTSTIAVSPHQSPSSFAKAALRSFEQLDLNRDGLVARDEVLLSLKNPGLAGEAAAVAATLYRQDRRNSLGRLSNDQWGPERGVTVDDLEQLPASALQAGFEKRFGECSAAVESFSPVLFAETPSADDVHQGGVSNCWWLAPLSHIASHQPAAIEQSFTVLETGQYRVALPDGAEVVIDPPTSAESAAFASSGRSGHWLTALEKARGAANSSFLHEEVVQRNLESSSLTRGIRQTTGDPAEQDWLLWTSLETTRNKMSEHLERGDVVVAATGPGVVPRLRGQGDRLEGLVPMHAYTVLGYDESTDSLTIRNPYGDTEWHRAENAGPDDGEFSIPLEDFHQLFSVAAYQVSAGPSR